MSDTQHTPRSIQDRLLDRNVCSPAHNSCRNDHICIEAANELDRLAAINEELVEALDAAETMLQSIRQIGCSARGTKPFMTTRKALRMVRAALARAKQ